MAKVIGLIGDRVKWEHTVEGEYKKVVTTSGYVYLLDFKGNLYRMRIKYDEYSDEPLSVDESKLFMTDVYDISETFIATPKGVYHIDTQKLLMKSPDVLLGRNCLLDDQRYLWMYGFDYDEEEFELKWYDRRFESVHVNRCVDDNGMSWICRYPSIHFSTNEYNLATRTLNVHNMLSVRDVDSYLLFDQSIRGETENMYCEGAACLTLENKVLIVSNTFVIESGKTFQTGHQITEICSAKQFSYEGFLRGVMSVIL